MTPEQEYRTWVSEHDVIVAGGAPKVVCPLCSDTHVICQFSTGSLTCQRKDCSNPHHLSPGYADHTEKTPGEGYP